MFLEWSPSVSWFLAKVLPVAGGFYPLLTNLSMLQLTQILSSYYVVMVFLGSKPYNIKEFCTTVPMWKEDLQVYILATHRHEMTVSQIDVSAMSIGNAILSWPLDLGKNNH